MTALSRGLEYNWLNMQEHEKIEKVTGSEDDDFVGVSKASGRGHLPSFIRTTRKLVVIEIAAGQQKQPNFVQPCSAQTVNRLHRQKAPGSANLDSSEGQPSLRDCSRLRFILDRFSASAVRVFSMIDSAKNDCWVCLVFPGDLHGVGELQAAFLNESRLRGRWWRPVGDPGGPKRMPYPLRRSAQDRATVVLLC